MRGPERPSARSGGGKTQALRARVTLGQEQHSLPLGPWPTPGLQVCGLDLQDSRS